MKRKSFLALFTSSILLTLSIPAHLNAASNVYELTEGIYQENRTLVPVRFVSEKLGAEVTWNKQNKMIEIRKENTEIKLVLGAKVATVNQENLELDTASFSSFGTTYVPARFVSQSLGADVSWNKQTNQVKILSEGKQILVNLKQATSTINPIQKISVNNQNMLINKLNEATDISSIKQVRTHFRGHFTDQFINTLIRDKGLKYETIPASSSSYVEYTGSKTARLVQSKDMGLNEVTNSTETLFRNILLVYTNGSWKVNQVNSFISSSPLNP